MAYSTSMNNASTHIGEATAGYLNIHAMQINPADWCKTECGRDKIAFVNANSDYSAPNRVRIERSRIANVYDGSGIVSNYQLPSKRGIKLFVQNTSVATLSDSTDPTVRIELPYAASLTLRVPAVPTSIVSVANIGSVIAQLLGFLNPNLEGATMPNWNCVFNYLNGSLDFTN